MERVASHFDFNDNGYIGSNGMTPSPASDNQGDSAAGKKWYRKVAHR